MKKPTVYPGHTSPIYSDPSGFATNTPLKVGDMHVNHQGSLSKPKKVTGKQGGNHKLTLQLLWCMEGTRNKSKAPANSKSSI